MLCCALALFRVFFLSLASIAHGAWRLGYLKLGKHDKASNFGKSRDLELDESIAVAAKMRTTIICSISPSVIVNPSV